MKRDAAAIIVAAGQGLRFGGPVRKQYLLLNRRPVLWWSLRAFQKSPSIREIIIVIPRADLQQVKKWVRAWRLRKPCCIVPGGATRADSVQQGLNALSPEIRWVAVHDGVRPLVKPDLIEQTLRHARRFRAAIAACPSKDTVKLSNGDRCVHSTPPRETVWLAQTPQVFGRKLLERAHQEGRRLRKGSDPMLTLGSDPFRKSITDDAQLVERLGAKVKLVEASAENIKITLPMDLVVAREIMREKK